ncbi:MAG: SIS domain-containing protein [Syntrophobacterales bacterium]|jgi:6-phospho-3-hexuloisomerase|nr:SIS domain-containing protein [Syntrophobacterales bacterium]
MDCLPQPPGGLFAPEPPQGLKFTQALDHMHEELGAVLSRITPDLAETLIKEVETAPRIFGCAAGRSGFILRGFLMRLMHLGFTVYSVGETITPRVRPGDLLIVMSGSGETAQPREMQRRANAVGARTLALTTHPASTIGREAQVTLTIPGTTKLTLNREATSVQCPGSLFEQATFFFLEAVVLLLYQRRLGHNQGEVLDRHADLE